MYTSDQSVKQSISIRLECDASDYKLMTQFYIKFIWGLNNVQQWNSNQHNCWTIYKPLKSHV